MLHELAVTDLGVIGELALVLRPGMTAVTGETGAGKTLVVEAIELLVGGRADPSMVRHGATKRWSRGGSSSRATEVVLRRVVPREGRSRAYVDGHLATADLAVGRGASISSTCTASTTTSRCSPPRCSARHSTASPASTSPRCEAARAGGARPSTTPRRAGRRRAGPGPRDRPAALPGRRAGGGRSRPIPTRTSASRPRRTSWPTPRPTRTAPPWRRERSTPTWGRPPSLAEAIAALDGRRPFDGAVGRLRDVAAELADVAADVRARGRGHRGRPRATGMRSGSAGSSSTTCGASTARRSPR